MIVPYPRIIDDHTWQKAREMRQHPQRKVWDRQRKHDVVYLLESILWCEHCGKRFRPGASNRISRYVTKDGVVHKRKSDTLRLRILRNESLGTGQADSLRRIRMISKHSGRESQTCRSSNSIALRFSPIVSRASTLAMFTR